jgi:hypothetical protein
MREMVGSKTLRFALAKHSLGMSGESVFMIRQRFRQCFSSVAHSQGVVMAGPDHYRLHHIVEGRATCNSSATDWAISNCHVLSMY